MNQSPPSAQFITDKMLELNHFIALRIRSHDIIFLIDTLTASAQPFTIYISLSRSITRLLLIVMQSYQTPLPS